MKRSHRRVHALAWVVLAPLLLLVIYLADRGRLARAPSQPALSSPSEAGVLP